MALSHVGVEVIIIIILPVVVLMLYAMIRITPFVVLLILHSDNNAVCDMSVDAGYFWISKRWCWSIGRCGLFQTVGQILPCMSIKSNIYCHKMKNFEGVIIVMFTS